MATGNPKFLVAPNAKGPGLDLPVEAGSLMIGVGVVAVVFVIGVFVYWRKLQNDTEADF